MPQENKAHNAFKSLLTRLVRVPKAEIDEQEERHTADRAQSKMPQPVKPRQIVPSPTK